MLGDELRQLVKNCKSKRIAAFNDLVADYCNDIASEAATVAVRGKTEFCFEKSIKSPICYSYDDEDFQFPLEELYQALNSWAQRERMAIRLEKATDGSNMIFSWKEDSLD